MSVMAVTGENTLIWAGWLLAAIIVAVLAFLVSSHLMKRKTRKITRHEKVSQEAYKAFEDRTGVIEPATHQAKEKKIVLDESAVAELKTLDKNRLARVRKGIIGSYDNFKDDMEGFVRDTSIQLSEIKDKNAVNKLSEQFALNRFNANSLEQALEENAMIYSKDGNVMEKYRSAGARTDYVGNIIP